MQIEHQRPEPDLSYAVRAPLFLTVTGGRTLTVESWTLEGVRFAEGMDIQPRKGVLTIPFQGVGVSFPITLAPGPDRQMLFQGLTGRERETLALFYRSILGGKMASTADMITSLDTPVDLVPMGETDDEKAEGEAKVAPRAWRAALNLAAYALLTLMVIGFLSGKIIGRLNSIELEQPRIAAPHLEHVAPEGAYVDKILVHTGQDVERGERLVVLSNPDTSAAIQDVREDIATIERRIAFAEGDLVAHDADHDAEARRLEAAIVTAEDLQSRSDDPMGAPLRAVLAAIEELDRFDAGRGTHAIWPRTRTTLTRRIDELYRDLARLKRELGNAKGAAEALDIIALEAGTVQSLPIMEDQYLQRGTFAALVEENRARTAVGWLPDHMAGIVYPGMHARIRTTDATGTHTIAGRVTHVVSGPDPARPSVYGILVTVHATGLTTRETRARFAPNAPVRLTLQRDTFGWVRRLFAPSDAYTPAP